MSQPVPHAPNECVSPHDEEPAPRSVSLEPVYIQKGTRAFVRTILAMCSGGFATFALLYCVQPMMPMLAQQFDLSAAQSSLILSVSTITLAIGLLITGPLSDALGRKPVMVVSLFAAAVFLSLIHI